MCLDGLSTNCDGVGVENVKDINRLYQQPIGNPYN